MSMYSNSQTVRDARAQFFAANSGTFGPDGGYGKKWVRMEIGPIPIYLPNTFGRIDAVKLHDLHHIATGYSTDLRGEAEIGAWEIGTGCRDYYHAWVLNSWAFALGLALAPRRAFRAFIRGLRSGTLYDTRYDDSLLNQTVGELRSRLRLQQKASRPTRKETASFAIWATIAMLSVALPAALGILLIVLAATAIFR